MAKAFYQVLLVQLHELRRMHAILKLRCNLKMVLIIERSNLRGADTASSHDVKPSPRTPHEHVKRVLDEVNSILSPTKPARALKTDKTFFEKLKRISLRKQRVAARWYLAFMLWKNPKLQLERLG